MAKDVSGRRSGGETVEAETKRRGVKGPQDVPVRDVNTALRGGSLEDRPVAVVEQAPEWPVAASLPGDEVHLAELQNHLGAITDVGTLATVLGLVVARCQACRVKPDVLAAAVKPADGAPVEKKPGHGR